jgi:chromosome segregation ATPase
MKGQVDWIRVAEFLILIVGFAFSVWRAWVAMNTKLNGMGERVNEIKSSCTSHQTDIENIKREQELSRVERTEIRERAAQALTKIDTMREEIAEERLAIQSTLHANEKAASERDAQLRERLARIDERLNVREMVSQVVREFKE